MRLFSVTCVKNEGDIIEAFIRHTATVVDHLVMLDNGGTDETRDIPEGVFNYTRWSLIINSKGPSTWAAVAPKKSRSTSTSNNEETT
jgi:hypothetical protein